MTRVKVSIILELDEIILDRIGAESDIKAKIRKQINTDDTDNWVVEVLKD